MTAKQIIRGMAWDHPRARNPLNAISQRWTKGTDYEVHWDARPLKDFEDQPLEELATRYDLMLIDHPFVGTAARSGLITPVNDWVDASYLRDQAEHSAGPSFSSYTWDDQQWALAIDAAAQFSAIRDDLLTARDYPGLPPDWESVYELVRHLADSSAKVALPLNPNHAYCAFLAITHSNFGPPALEAGKPIDTAAGTETLLFLKELANGLHPLSKDADPIVISDRMAESDEIAYVPLMFGYSNYARPGFRSRILRFADAPAGRSGLIGSVLGGVGLALSTQSTVADAAAALARNIGEPKVQSGIYFESGGQPGHATAWTSPEVNQQIGNFFQATSRTISQALMRPRIPGHRLFQVEAGELIHEFLWSQGLKPEKCMSRLNQMAEKRLNREVQDD